MLVSLAIHVKHFVLLVIVTGQSIFLILQTKSHFQTNAMGYDYVGWSQNTQQDRNVDITFRFDDLKNFTSMRVHCGINENIGARYLSVLQ